MYVHNGPLAVQLLAQAQLTDGHNASAAKSIRVIIAHAIVGVINTREMHINHIGGISINAFSIQLWTLSSQRNGRGQVP